MGHFRLLSGTFIVAIVAVLLGTALPRDTLAFYGGARFYNQAAPSRLLHNAPGDEFIVTNPSDTNDVSYILYTLNATWAWESALSGSPNSLTKPVLVYNAAEDPAANVLVHIVDRATVEQQANCGNIPDTQFGCNDLQVNGVNDIWIDEDLVASHRIQHELGHTLQFEDQYYADTHCADGQFQGGHSHANFDSIMDCDTAISNANDEVPFQNRYEPTLQSANPTYPDTWNASWNAFTQTGNVRAYFPASQVEYRYYWENWSDSGGTLVSSGYLTNSVDHYKDLAYTATGRFCLLSKVYNEVGYPGTRPWSPRSQYSCIGNAQSQTAGFFLATSDRNSPSNNNLYLRVENFSLFGRDIAIVGPAYQNIGCGYIYTAWLATRQCYITMTRGQYPYLMWFAKDPANGSVYSWGYLDFE